MRASRELTVAEMVHQVASDRLLLPGIQRGFVWKQGQIETLFDSVLRGYPIGPMLLWRTRPTDHKQLRFTRLTTDYRGSTVHATAHPKATAQVEAVLDGQQRLTAFNIGLRGSYAATGHGLLKRLYLDLDTDLADAGSEVNRYHFEFRPQGATGEEPWFPVGDAVGLHQDSASLDEAMIAADVAPSTARRRILKTLVVALNVRRLVRLDIEAGDLDRMLNVFARINKGGTPLTYVELLVSTATARWTHLNARKEITRLRQAMNESSPEGFKFSPDRIVKAGLVLMDVKEPKFHIESFLTGDRARRLESIWPQFSQAMTIATSLLAQFGLSARTLPAENVVIPLAYYAHHRGLKPAYVEANVHEKDRRLVKAFVARTLLQRRYWTGAVDPVLVATRAAIRQHGASAFPLAEIEEALDASKPIRVGEALIDELASLPYRDRRTAVLLRLLFPHMVLDGLTPGKLDKDHVFPISRFSAAARLKGLTSDKWGELRVWADLLPNLQLLRAEDNRGGAKVNKMPKPWLADLTQASKRRYSLQHVKHVPADLVGAGKFWDQRYEALRQDITRLLQA